MELFAALLATWPAAEVRRLEPWTLRRGAGGGNRTSAATLDGPLADPAVAAAAMRGWGQRPLFLVRPGEGALDAVLSRGGYRLHDASVVMAAPAGALAEPPGEAAIFCEAPPARLAELWAAAGIGPARQAVAERAPWPKVWLLGRLGDRAAGAGFVALHGTVAMLSALVVAPEARRQGLGARLTRAAAAWAAAEGAATLGLAVTRANAAARALYAGLGMAEAATYHYRIAPED
jgi:ribosomal protein S18 acetylase RimI-like enzyme